MIVQTLTTHPSDSYSLLDSGEGEKLEQFGSVIVARPDPQVLWKKLLPPNEWEKADIYFFRKGEKSGWQFRKKIPERWELQFGGLHFWIRPSAFKHVGLFPEQLPNWEWLKQVISHSARDGSVSGGKSKVINQPQVLNLFGYTGGATLACVQAGAAVVHVDGSKVAITLARENTALSGLANKPIRWILDDVTTFVKREIKRGRRYDGLILDPPAYGHGPKKEIWKIEKDFLPLLDLCAKILSDEPIFFLMNGYASGYSEIAYGNALYDIISKSNIEIGELTIQESSNDGRLLPAGIFARLAFSKK